MSLPTFVSRTPSSVDENLIRQGAYGRQLPKEKPRGLPQTLHGQLYVLAFDRDRTCSGTGYSG